MNRNIMACRTIKKPALFSYGECLWFLDRDLDECLYRIEDREVVRALRIGADTVVFRIADGGDVLRIAVGDSDAQHLGAVESFVRAWIDADTNLAPFYELLRSVPALGYMPERYSGLRLVGIPDMFECLCWSVIGQQINLSFAYTLKRRLVEHFGGVVAHEGQVLRTFPACDAIAGLDVEQLRALQFSGAKARYLTQIAQAFCRGDISRSHAEPLPREERLRLLTGLAGVGPWTANYVLMKSFRDPDAVAVGDAGLLNALLRHGLIAQKNDTARIDALFAQFAGFRAYLVLYLWRSLSEPAENTMHHLQPE